MGYGWAKYRHSEGFEIVRFEEILQHSFIGFGQPVIDLAKYFPLSGEYCLCVCQDTEEVQYNAPPSRASIVCMYIVGTGGTL